ncbi:MAG TPA: ribosome maturation factor RimP [Blastocatellia bacterium]|nr:ribosome maturation factor RimP [Blastocatellia bacterium]
MSDFDREAIGRVIERVTAREQLELVHWELLGPPGRLMLRVFIDKPTGVGHGDCEAVSNQVGVLIDMEDLIPCRYTLEVSSPGIERGLYKVADFERFAGKRIKLRTSEPINGQRNFHGRLEGISGNTVRLDEDRAGRLEIPYEKVVKANLEYEF